MDDKKKLKEKLGKGISEKFTITAYISVWEKQHAWCR